MAKRKPVLLRVGSLMSQSWMLSQQIKAMIVAEREYDDAVKVFDAAIREKPDSNAEISEALQTMLEKHKAVQAFGERVFSPL
jgi:prefoldin subunit 5